MITISKVSHDVSFYFSKGVDTINRSVSVEVKVLPVVAVSPLSLSAIEGKTCSSCKKRLEVSTFVASSSGEIMD
jgi:hypothetical protein